MKEALYALIKNGKKGVGPAILKALLWVLSMVYRLIVMLRIFLFSVNLLPSTRLSKPVISVGNITTGGAGKTPFVAMLARHFMERHKKPAILLRGYMSQAGNKSDEAKWYERYVRGAAVVVGEDRSSAAKHFLAGSTCDIFLMDDGFQHLGVKRGLNIALIDATDPWGGGHLLPRGFLREPISSLGRADVIVLTKTDLGKNSLTAIQQRIARVNKKALIVHSVHEPELLYEPQSDQSHSVELIRQKKVIVLCSIGSPRSFNATLQQLKAQVLDSYHFMDHHVYTIADIQPVLDAAVLHGADFIVTTEKDLVKLQGFLPQFSPSVRWVVLRIHVQLTKNKDEFLKRIDHLL